MIFSFRRAPSRIRFGLLGLGAVLLLSLLFVMFPPDGVERAAWAQFIGRFHLLTVHFPIALILLVPVLELAGRDRRLLHLRSSVDFIWALAALSSLTAAFLGWCLARSGGYSGRLVTQHMWGGLAVASVCWLCWMARGRVRDLHLDAMYAVGLVAAMAAVSWTGYRGGQLSQGENHLTEQMPAGLRKLIGLSVASEPVPRSDPAFFYGAHVEPIFIDHCYSCHGPEKQKSRLRLDSYQGLMRGGKHGLVIKVGNPKASELIRRVTLSPADDDAMPPQGKRPLSANEVKVIALWIEAGASSSLAANAIKDAPTNAEPAVAEVTFAEIDPAAVARSRAPLAPVVAQLKQRYPGLLDYESRGSANLVVDASLIGARFGDDDLGALQPISGQIVVADFSGTAISDRSAASLAAMKHVRILRLMHTRITDNTVLALGGLDQLESLSVFDTGATPVCLKVVEQMPKLHRFYAGDTKIPSDVPVPEAMKGKLLF
ncbi:MAG TPA: c-type cytochrome domain-containing protein [Acidobacteriaceae bacterium]|nr:c-type cytochrome domain-containing protein [Acidobacteriaceae bacterium]